MDTKTIETSTTTAAAEVPASEAPKTPKAPKATKKAAAEKEAPKAKKVAAKVAKVAKASTKAIAKASTKKSDGPRPESKKAEVIAMIQAKGGATLEAIMKRTDWQKHTVRGFMATVPAKLGLKLKSEKVEGARTYSA
jgi:hypothetical protein